MSDLAVGRCLGIWNWSLSVIETELVSIEMGVYHPSVVSIEKDIFATETSQLQKDGEVDSGFQTKT